MTSFLNKYNNIQLIEQQMSDTCDICANTFNKTTRSPVTCSYCLLTACRNCCEKYILSVLTPKCMNNACHGEWSRKFMNIHLSKTFVNTRLKQYKENQLFDIEKQYLPASQLRIEYDLKRERIQKELDILYDTYDELRFNKFNSACDDIYAAVYPDVIENRQQIVTVLHELEHTDDHYEFCRDFKDFSRLFGLSPVVVKYEFKLIQNSYTVTDTRPLVLSYKKNLQERVTKLKAIFENHIVGEKPVTPQVSELYKRIAREFETFDIINDSLVLLSYEIFNELRETISAKQNELHVIESSFKGRGKKTENHFVKSCANPNCRGFLSNEWKCGLCNCLTCSECNELSDNGESYTHVCDPNNVKTAKLLANDTKNCPKCQIHIYKTDGCDQMWCTQCHTAFSWLTGAIEKKVHNPHYYEWMRKNGGVPREPGDIVCGNELNHELIYLMEEYLTNHEHLPDVDDIYERFYIIIRRTIHISEVERPKFLPRDYTFEQERARYQYLTNKCTLAAFKQHLYHLYKMNLKRADTLVIVDLLITTITDIVFRFLEELKTAKPNEVNVSILDEVDTIIDYVNECFKDIGETYSNVPHRIVPYNETGTTRFLNML